MRNSRSFSALQWGSVFLLLGAVILTTLQLVRFSRLRTAFPVGMIIGGVPVGGLDRQGSAQRLREAYTRPVELNYSNAVIHLEPNTVGYQLDMESMLAAADQARSQQSFWADFWNYLWGRLPEAAEVPLRANFSETRLRAYLAEIAERYDQPPTEALPAVGTVNFQPGKQGTALDVDRSVLLIESALRSPSQRRVDLPLARTAAQRPSFRNLEILLKQTIDIDGFEGLVELYLQDLQTAQSIHFAYRQGENLPVQPDVAFTGASIIKIPIMVSIFRRVGDEPDPETVKLLEEMIERSGNDPADWVMERVIDRNRAPLEVTENMQTLGLANTFLAGHFYPGAPLLDTFETPANLRADIDTDPDIYNQTTASDLGMLLEDMYQCAEFGGGALMAAFPDQFSQLECQTMLTYLSRNKIGTLIEGGVPDGTPVAHKHGWVTYFGVMYSLGDAGVVYTPGGNYVLVIFLYHPTQLVWDPAAKLVADLARAIYNYYNFAP